MSQDLTELENVIKAKKMEAEISNLKPINSVIDQRTIRTST